MDNICYFPVLIFWLVPVASHGGPRPLSDNPIEPITSRFLCRGEGEKRGKGQVSVPEKEGRCSELGLYLSRREDVHC